MLREFMPRTPPVFCLGMYLLYYFSLKFPEFKTLYSKKKKKRVCFDTFYKLGTL